MKLKLSEKIYQEIPTTVSFDKKTYLDLASALLKAGGDTVETIIQWHDEDSDVPENELIPELVIRLRLPVKE